MNYDEFLSELKKFGLLKSQTKIPNHLKGTSNSKQSDENSLLFSDNKTYIEDAYQKGCKYFVTELKINLPNVILIEAPAKKAFSLYAQMLHHKPFEKLKFIGITGTNGKTTTTWMIRNLATKNSTPSTLIGTIYFYVGDTEYPATHTTPDPMGFAKLLEESVNKKISYVVMEVSSHALDQDRVFPVKFDHVGFTNFTQDHLDYHKTMEEYFKAKLKLLTEYSKDKKVHAGATLENKFPKTIHAKFHPMSELKNIEPSPEGISFEYKSQKFVLPMLGVHYLENFLIASAIAEDMNLKNKPEFWKDFFVPGRSTIIRLPKNRFVVADYAHTPDAIDKLMDAIDAHYKNFKKVLLFGCGGDRDATKRPKMGAIGNKKSDFLIITNDNPRSEKPEAIANQILEGCEQKNKVKIVLDRKAAIDEALQKFSENCVVVIAGKGHEATIDFGTHKVNFNDMEYVMKEYK